MHVLRRDENGNKIVKMPDGTIAKFNRHNIMVEKIGSEKMPKKRNGKKLTVKNGRFIGQFKANQKGLINMDSLDDLVKF